MSTRVWCGVVVVFLAACPPSPVVPSASIDAGLAAVADAAVDAGAPMPLTFSLAVQVADGGQVIEVAIDAGLEVEPLSALSLRASLPLEDARVRLFDWTDAVVPSNDTQRVSDAGFEYRIEPLSALRSGRQYVLQVDAESQDVFRDSLGRPHDELRVPLRMSGAVEPEPASQRKKKKNRR